MVADDVEHADTRHEVDVAVIGAGQAGLSTAYFLDRFGFAPETGYVVLDDGDEPGGAWRLRPPSLTMDKVHGIFDLPGTAWDRADVPDSARAAEAVPAYFAAYERTHALPVHRPVAVDSVRRDDDRDRLVVTGTTGGRVVEWAARAVANATGTWARPYLPYYPGVAEFAGRQLHYSGYRGPADLAGLDVVVVGGGTSAMHVLSELAGVAASTTWVTRRPPVFRDDDFTPDVGREAVALVEERVRAGLPPQSVVSVTGLSYTGAVREAYDKGALHRLPMFDLVTPDAVTWADGRRQHADVIVWCTGFRPAIDHLAPLRLRERGGGIRVDGTRVVAEPRLHLVGYGPSASTIGANRAGRTAAREIRDLLAADRERAA